MNLMTMTNQGHSKVNCDGDVKLGLFTWIQSIYFTTLYFKTTLDYTTTWFGPKGQFSVLNDFI